MEIDHLLQEIENAQNRMDAAYIDWKRLQTIKHIYIILAAILVGKYVRDRMHNATANTYDICANPHELLLISILGSGLLI